MQRDIVCLISGEDNLLEYKQKVRLTAVGSLDDVHEQLAKFLQLLGVNERVVVDLYDGVLEKWKPLDTIETCPDKARLRIRRVPLPYEPPIRTVSREKAARRKGDERTINGRKRIWSGTRWNCEHDRRLSECKFCAAQKSAANNGERACLRRQKSDSLVPLTPYQKRRRLGSYDHLRLRGRQNSLPEGANLDKVGRRIDRRREPLQLSRCVGKDILENNRDDDAFMSVCLASTHNAKSTHRAENVYSTLSLSASASSVSNKAQAEDDGFWDLFDVDRDLFA